jgi:hypothetical protein
VQVKVEQADLAESDAVHARGEPARAEFPQGQGVGRERLPDELAGLIGVLGVEDLVPAERGRHAVTRYVQKTRITAHGI